MFDVFYDQLDEFSKLLTGEPRVYVGFEGNGRFWFMRYCCFAGRIIHTFITLSVWRLLVIFGISVLLDPYIL